MMPGMGTYTNSGGTADIQGVRPAGDVDKAQKSIVQQPAFIPRIDEHKK